MLKVRYAVKAIEGPSLFRLEAEKLTSLSSVAVTEMISLYSLVLLLLFMVQDQLQQKIVCPGVVTCLNASPDGLFLAAAVAEAIYLWEVSRVFCVLKWVSSSFSP